MSKNRLEAFSDGVIAIIITIMVLELKVPHGAELAALAPLLPVFLTYCMSFVYVGIYWNNHHHMFQATEHVNGAILWANLHLLFWLSIVPFVTKWVGEYYGASLPTAVYGCVLVCAAIAYTILQALIVRLQPQSKLAEAVARDVKGKMSIVLYLVAIALAFARPWMSDALYVAVALIWLVPDRRIESKLSR